MQSKKIIIQVLSSWNHCMICVGQSMISDFIFHGHLRWIFRRKQIIRTHLLSETSSDYFCLVRVARIELTASWTPFKRATKTALHPDICCGSSLTAPLVYPLQAVLSSAFFIFLGFFLDFSLIVQKLSMVRLFHFRWLPLPRQRRCGRPHPTVPAHRLRR